MKSIQHPQGTSSSKDFCWECRTLTCRDYSHEHQILGTKCRVPKRDCSKTQWKAFLKYMGREETIKIFEPKAEGVPKKIDIRMWK